MSEYVNKVIFSCSEVLSRLTLTLFLSLYLCYDLRGRRGAGDMHAIIHATFVGSTSTRGCETLNIMNYKLFSELMIFCPKYTYICYI